MLTVQSALRVEFAKVCLFPAVDADHRLDI